MARPGVTYQDIVTAVNHLKGENKNITIENIRAYLGTGSVGTINKYLRQWRDVQTSAGKIASKENLPEELISLIKGLWEGIVTQSAEQFEPIEANYQQEIVGLKTELEKYQNNNQRWQKLFNQWQQEKTQLANEKMTLEQALEFAHKENQSLQNKNDTLLQQLQEKQARIDELHRLHQQTQTNLEHYRESVREQRLLDQQQFEKEKQQYLFEIKGQKEQSILQQQKYAELQQQNQLLNQAHLELKKQHQNTIELIKDLKIKIEILEKENIEFSQTSKHWHQQCKETENKLENKLVEVTSLQNDNKAFNQQLADLKQSLRNAQDQHKLLASEKWDLAKEKARLEGQIQQMQKMITA